MGSKGQICKFWSPFHQFGTGVARNCICGVHIYLRMSNLRDDKIPQRGDGVMGLGAKIVNFGTHFVHLEQV